MSVKKCFRCNELNPSDDMTPDAFGDSSVLMCEPCMFDLKEDNSKYILVETSEYTGTTFVRKAELDDLIRHWGEENVKQLTK